MIKDCNGRKMTPTEVAKEIIVAAIDDLYFWDEEYVDLYERATEKERISIDDALKKQRRRVRKLLGYGPMATLCRLY